jgi:hypothetical protein
VRDHDRGTVDEAGDGVCIDRFPSNHRVGDPGKARDLSRDRDRGLAQLAEGVEDMQDVSVAVVHECDHAKLDDLVLAMVEACRLYIDDDADLVGGSIGWQGGRPRRQPSYYPVFAAGL